jgi:exopolyphosphatase/guanosine-5'-triphosphate,3'-diphosphate pyrophosphatase
MEQNNDNLLATVDLGSNSFRLLIGQHHQDGTVFPIDQIKESVRLASGLDANNNLTKESQLSALTVLSRFGERLSGMDPAKVRVVATSTLRVAKNAAEFIVIANKALGFPIEVISGKEEARLVYIGAMHSLAYTEDSRLVIDIGGGSTEFIIGNGYKPKIMESVTMGCVSYTGRYFPDYEFTESNFTNAILAARSKIQSMEHLFVKQNWSRAIGTSGTAKTIFELCVQAGFSTEITLDGMLQLKKALIKSKNPKGIKLEGIKEERKLVIAGGLSIMIAIFHELGIDTMTISDGALREGTMYDLIGRRTNSDLREVTVNDMRNRFHLNLEQGDRVADLTYFIQSSVVPKKEQNPERMKLLKWACELYEVGLSISHNDYHKHGAYILQNSDLAGFSKPEQSIIAELVKLHRGSIDKVHAALVKMLGDGLEWKIIIGVISFRLAVIFNRNRKDIDYKKIIKVENVTNKGYDLVIEQEWLMNNPLTLFSLNEEFDGWKKFGVVINLISR